MPSPSAGATRSDAVSIADNGRSPSSRGSSAMFPNADPASHMLGLPKSYPRLKRWVAFAVIVGAFAAIVLLGLFSM